MSPLVDFGIKGTLLLLVTYGSSIALRRASAGVRSLIWTCGLIALLLLAPLAALTPDWRVPLLPADPSVVVPPASEKPPPAVAIAEPTAIPEKRGPATPPVVAESTGKARSPDLARPAAHTTGPAPELPPPAANPTGPAPELAPPAADSTGPAPEFPRPERAGRSDASRADWLPTLARSVDWWLASWAAVAVALLGYLSLGVTRARKLVRTARPVHEPRLLACLEQAMDAFELRGPIYLLESDAITAPITWHLGQPQVIVPTAIHRWPRDRQLAVLVHELAHVGRQDCRLQLLAWIAVAVHWFNPLAWLALARLRQERERACDDIVIGTGIRPSAYATHLVEIGRGAIGPIATPVGVGLVRRGQLRERVTAILDPETGHQSPNRSITVSIVAIALGLVLPLAALQPVAAAGPQPTPSAEPSTAAASGTPAPAQQASPALDELVQMRIHGVSPEFIEAMNELLDERLDIEGLVQMRIHGISPEYVRSMRATFGADIGIKELVQARIHGVSPEYAGRMTELVAGSVDFDDLVQMRIHGLSTDEVAELKELLPGEELRVRTLVQMAIHNVTPAMIRRLQEAGFEDLTAKELVDIKIHGMERVMLKRRGEQQ